MNIHLTVPGPDALVNPNLIVKPAPLQQWVAELPYADRVASAAALHKLLSQLNRYPEPVPTRLELMLTLLQPYHTLSQAVIENTLQHQEGQLLRNDRLLSEAIEPLTTEMAYGFKHIINEIQSGRRKKQSPEACARIIGLAMQLLARSLLFAYARYRQTSQTIWREIGQLFTLAHNRNLLRLPVTGLNGSGQPACSIETLFKRIALLMLLDPYRLTQGEIWRANAYLKQRAGSARLGPAGQPEQPTGCFLIEPGTPVKPVKYDPEKLPLDLKNHLLLETTPLNLLINADLQRVQQDQPVELLDQIPHMNRPQAIGMLKNMLIAWHLTPSRRHLRMEQYDWLGATLGISAVHRHIRDQLTGDVIGDTGAPEPQEEEESYEISSLSSTSPASRENVRTQRWRQVNIGPGGVCIELPSSECRDIRVGEVVLMESEMRSGSEWKLGIIRRIMHPLAGDRVEVGIQFIPGVAQSATLESGPGNGLSGSDPQPAVVIHRGEKHPDILLTIPRSYQANAVHLLQPDVGESLRIITGKLLDANNSHDRFIISPLKS